MHDGPGEVIAHHLHAGERLPGRGVAYDPFDWPARSGGTGEIGAVDSSGLGAIVRGKSPGEYWLGPARDHIDRRVTDGRALDHDVDNLFGREPIEPEPAVVVGGGLGSDAVGDSCIAINVFVSGPRGLAVLYRFDPRGQVAAFRRLNGTNLYRCARDRPPLKVEDPPTDRHIGGCLSLSLPTVVCRWLLRCARALGSGDIDRTDVRRLARPDRRSFEEGAARFGVSSSSTSSW